MAGDFHTRQDWITLALAFSVWFAHFMIVWSISIAFPGMAAGRWLALPVTLAAFGGLWWLWRRRQDKALTSVSSLSVLIATAAIAFSTLPPLIG